MSKKVHSSAVNGLRMVWKTCEKCRMIDDGAMCEPWCKDIKAEARLKEEQKRYSDDWKLINDERRERRDRIAALEEKNKHLQVIIDTAKEAISKGWNPIWELEADKPSGDGKGIRCKEYESCKPWLSDITRCNESCLGYKSPAPGTPEEKNWQCTTCGDNECESRITKGRTPVLGDACPGWQPKSPEGRTNELREMIMKTLGEEETNKMMGMLDRVNKMVEGKLRVVGVSGYCQEHKLKFTSHLYCDKCIIVVSKDNVEKMRELGVASHCLGMAIALIAEQTQEGTEHDYQSYIGLAKEAFRRMEKAPVSKKED